MLLTILLGALVEQSRRAVELVVDLGDPARHGREDVTRRLDRLDSPNLGYK